VFRVQVDDAAPVFVLFVASKNSVNGALTLGVRLD